jgi:hypothetical protein
MGKSPQLEESRGTDPGERKLEIQTAPGTKNGPIRLHHILVLVFRRKPYICK